MNSAPRSTATLSEVYVSRLRKKLGRDTIKTLPRRGI